jgi:hypothetical protein
MRDAASRLISRRFLAQDQLLFPRLSHAARALTGDIAMTRNIGRIDQFLRIMIGVTLFAYAVKNGTLTTGWLVPGVVGVILVITAFFSYCPLYSMLGVTTRSNLDRTA